MENKTQEDAFHRVLDARMGSFVNATDDYLLALRSNLHQWIDQIDVELNERIKREQECNHGNA